MISVISNPRERNRFLRFAFVGLIGAIIDFGVMNLMVHVFNTPFVLAGTISFIAAVLSNFTWNRYWTYPDSRSKPVHQQLVIFTIVSVIGLMIRIPTLAILDPIIFRICNLLFHDIPLTSVNTISHNLTLAIAVVIVMFWNFFVNRYWTYNDID